MYKDKIMVDSQEEISEVLKSVSVLLVEDDNEIRHQLSFFLRPKVGGLYTAADGKEGIAAYNEHAPDLIVTDIRMPHMDGLEMVKDIKKKNKDVPVIITTAFNEQVYFMQSIDLGVDQYVLKPTNPYLLLEALYKCARGLLQRREIETANRYIRFIVDSSPTFIVLAGKDGTEYINKTFLTYLGFDSLEDFRRNKKNLEELFVKVEGLPYHKSEKKHWIPHLIKNPGKDILVYLKNKSQREEDENIYLVCCSKFPEADKYIFSFTDITHIEKERQEFKQQAITDMLTGIYNRKKLLDNMKKEIIRSNRYQTPLSLIMFDIDRFKLINDTYGHMVGDKVLKKISRLISENIREIDTFARWGGDEFLILVPETDLAGARNLADKLGAIISRTDFGKAGSISSAFGVVQFRRQDDMERFLERVDQDLYQAKKKGWAKKNRPP